MLFVADDALVLRLLTQLVARLEPGRADVLLRAGMDAGQLAALRALRLLDLRSLAASTTPVVWLAIDPEALALSLQGLAERNAYLRLRDTFIAQGAPPVLMRTLFGLCPKATFARRRELNVRRGRGRSALPPIEIRESIETRWCTIREPDPRRRYLALREAFPQISFDALFAVVSAYEAMVNERANPRRPVRHPTHVCARRSRRHALRHTGRSSKREV